MKRKGFLIAGIVLLVLGVGGFFARSLFSPKQAKLEVLNTNVPASVYVDGQEVGSTTPYEEHRKPGEITLKLVPVTSGAPLAPWETKVSLVEGVTTVVKRDFGPTLQTSGGELLSFEKIGGKKAELVVVSVPDSAQVKLDGESRGFTPLPVVDVAPGEHEIGVSYPGYIEREIHSVKTVVGYRLTVVVFLAEDQAAQKQAEEEKEATPEATVSQAMVEILETGTGFLRVRAEPSIGASESARVTPGKQYPYLDKDDGGWFKIEYEKGKNGWISSRYAKKVVSRI
ncbi:MAG: PEGA domain-containing protein [Candidatus Blackburnbacteria bacterium]|nr:PEGA domain-containing protein [Candidatus Blackburnbacteria bacterium]